MKKVKKRNRRISIILVTALLIATIAPLNTFADTYDTVKDITLKSSTPDQRDKVFYDIYKGKEQRNIDDEVVFFKDALMNQDHLKYWAEMAYNIYKSDKNTYMDHAGNGFDKDFGYGHYLDLVNDLSKNLTVTKSLNSFQTEMSEKLAKTLNKKMKASDFLERTKVSQLDSDIGQTVLYSSAIDFDQEGKTPKHHYNAFALVFYNFKVHPLVDEYPYETAIQDLTLNAAIDEENKNDIPGFEYSFNAENSIANRYENSSYQTAPVGGDMSYNSSTTLSSSISNSEQFNFGETLGVEIAFQGKVPAIASFSQSTSFEFTAAQVLETATSKEKTELTEKGKSTSFTYDLPPHTSILAELEQGRTYMKLGYDSPLGLTYDVAVYSANGNFYDDNMLIQDWDPDLYDQWTFVTTFGGGDLSNSNAADNLYNRAIAHVNDSGYEKNYGVTELRHVDRGTTKINSLDWSKILATTTAPVSASKTVTHLVKEVINTLTTKIPMSVTGGTITEESDGFNTVTHNPLPLYALERIKLPFDYSKDIKLNAGTSTFLDNIPLRGVDKDNIDYYGFDKYFGLWQLLDEGGTPISGNSNEVAKIIVNPVTKNVELIGVGPGTVYAKYMINEKTYMDDTSKQYASNSTLKETAIMKVKVGQGTKPVFGGTVKASGEATVFVNDPPVDINSIETIDAGIYDARGIEIDTPVSWEAMETPTRGILVDNNKLSVTKAGSFHIRAFYPGYDNAYSDWITVTSLYPESGTTKANNAIEEPVAQDNSLAPEYTDMGNYTDDNSISRSSYTEFLGNMTEFLVGRTTPISLSQTFNDVDYSAPYSKYIEYAANLGLVVGNGNGNFKPDHFLTAEEMSIIMDRYAAILSKMLTDDYKLNLDEATKQRLIQWAETTSSIFKVEHPILNGENSKFMNAKTASKEEVIKYVENLSSILSAK